jgi:hydroxymethylbilane synthase
LRVADLPVGAVVATSSTRRKAQLLVIHPGLTVVDIRGNVLTRLQKVAGRAELDATILALAGITRLNYRINPEGRFEGTGVPEGLWAAVLEPSEMLPCVGQAAVGLEVRTEDERLDAICARLNDAETLACVTAERAFLAAMGGGCQSPVAAWAEVVDGRLRMRAVSFVSSPVRRTEAERPISAAVELGQGIAAVLKG